MSDAIISLDVLKSKEKHHYKGKGFIKNEIISFYDANEKTKFIYDKKIKRLIKSNNESIIAIDFIKEEMKINISNKEFFIKLNSKNVEDNNEEKFGNVVSGSQQSITTQKTQRDQLVSGNVE